VSDPRDAAVEEVAWASTATHNEDGQPREADAEEWEGERMLTALAADPARARAVVAFLLTEEELARALHGRLSVERGSINHDEAGLRGEPDAWMRSLARAVLAALRSPDPADAPEGRS
jgi:hypothetical protein